MEMDWARTGVTLPARLAMRKRTASKLRDGILLTSAFSVCPFKTGCEWLLLDNKDQIERLLLDNERYIFDI